MSNPAVCYERRQARRVCGSRPAGLRHVSYAVETALTGTGSRRDDSAHCSWLREVIPNFVNTLPRWYWTVRVLMNSRVPISGLDRPPWASRAIWASCSVSASPGESTRSGLARRAPLAAASIRPARSPNAPISISCNMPCAACRCSRASPRRSSECSHSP